MNDWAYQFRTALEAGAVLPMDFGYDRGSPGSSPGLPERFALARR